MCKSKHSIETIFCEILEEKFGIERSVAKDNLTHIPFSIRHGRV